MSFVQIKPHAEQKSMECRKSSSKIEVYSSKNSLQKKKSQINNPTYTALKTEEQQEVCRRK